LGTSSFTRPLQRGVRRQSFRGSAKSLRYLNVPNHVPIELGQFLCGLPKLRVHSTTNRLNVVPAYKFCCDLESCDIPGPALFHVPVARDLDRVLLVRDRIEDRLLWKPGRKLTPSRGLDQLKLFRTNRSEKRDRFHAV